VRAHRFAFMDQVGKIPDGLQLDHQCRNPACCNPAHLETVTPKENTQRGNAGKHWADKRASYLGNAEGGAADVPFLTRSNIGKCVNNQSPLVACGRGGDVAATLQAGMGGNGNAGNGSEMVVAVAHALTGEGFDASEDGTGRGTPLVPTYTLAIRGRGESHDLEYRSDGTANALLTPNGGRGGIGVGAIAFDTTQITSKANYSNPKPGDPCHPLVALGHPPAIAFDARQSDVIQYGEKTGPLDTNGTSMAIAFSCKDHGADAGDIAPTLRSMGHDGSHANGGGQMAVGSGMQVRRLTPLECERLQGFPDGWTDVPYRGKPASDGPRYKVIGNSMAVNCMSWLGQRIQMVEEIQDREAA
jgi:DNA (cytosine-5)-methyltransferase 1